MAFSFLQKLLFIKFIKCNFFLKLDFTKLSQLLEGTMSFQMAYCFPELVASLLGFGQKRPMY